MKTVIKGTFTTGEKWQEVANNENEFDKTMLSIEKNGACNWPDEILCYGNYVPVYVSRWFSSDSSTAIKTTGKLINGRTITNDKHMRMIKELGWDNETTCKELGCIKREYNAFSTKGIGYMSFKSAAILCKKYNEIMKPESPVTVDQLVED